MRLKSPLEHWTIDLPRDLTVQELHELAFRRTKGRYPKFELRHDNTLLPSSQAPISHYIHCGPDVFITPLEAATATTVNSITEDLCLVKIYTSYEQPDYAYWELKNTTKTLASVVFSYYAWKITKQPLSSVGMPFTIWRNLHDIGDKHLCGTIEPHWQSLSKLLNPQFTTGHLNEESMVDTKSVEEERLRKVWIEGQPLVLKVQLGEPAIPDDDNRKTLSRLEVLKQMFDAFVNRVLAYNFQTHIGLVTFGTTATLSQTITHAIENFRHQLSNTSAEGDTALWDSKYCDSESLVQRAN